MAGHSLRDVEVGEFVAVRLDGSWAVGEQGVTIVSLVVVMVGVERVLGGSGARTVRVEVGRRSCLCEDEVG